MPLALVPDSGAPITPVRQQSKLQMSAKGGTKPGTFGPLADLAQVLESGRV
jgi:hypothetical protein